jgi:hypothetical protein
MRIKASVIGKFPGLSGESPIVVDSRLVQNPFGYLKAEEF